MVSPSPDKEIGIRIVVSTVKAWVHRFITSCRKSRMERIARELTAVELRNAEEEIIREAQTETYGEEIAALKGGQPTTKRNSILNLTRMTCLYQWQQT